MVLECTYVDRYLHALALRVSLLFPSPRPDLRVLAVLCSVSGQLIAISDDVMLITKKKEKEKSKKLAITIQLHESLFGSTNQF